MGITGILSNAFGAVKNKGLGAARVAAREMSENARKAGVGKSFARRLGAVNFDNGDEILAGMGGVMRNATTSNTTSRTASNVGEAISKATRGSSSNLPANQIAQNFTAGGTRNVNWDNVVSGLGNEGLTRAQKAGLGGAGIGAALARASGGRGRGRRNTWR